MQLYYSLGRDWYPKEGPGNRFHAKGTKQNIGILNSLGLDADLKGECCQDRVVLFREVKGERIILDNVCFLPDPQIMYFASLIMTKTFRGFLCPKRKRKRRKDSSLTQSMCYHNKERSQQEE